MLGKRPLSLIELTVDRLINRKVKTVGLLASPTTISEKLYEQPLHNAGIKVHLLDVKQQKVTEDMIRQTIAGTFRVTQLKQQTLLLRRCYKDLPVVLGCTELSLIAASLNSDLLIDPLTIVVDAIFGYNKDKS